MKRKIMIVLASAASAAATGSLALGLAAAAPAATTPKTVQGTVGPGFTISLTLDGRRVTSLKQGVRYRFVIRDRSSIHNFRLSGPGLSRELTTVDSTGTRSALLTLRKGTYGFVCDPHAGSMHGSFRVV
jgi:plastocyanin